MNALPTLAKMVAAAPMESTAILAIARGPVTPERLAAHYYNGRVTRLIMVMESVIVVAASLIQTVTQTMSRIVFMIRALLGRQ